MALSAEKPLWKKLVWFVLLWAGGVATAGAIGYVIKMAMATQL
jgi:hypothetical protein